MGLGYRDECQPVKGIWLVSKEVVKLMKEQKKGGSIINMTSYQGFTCTELLSAYCTSKAAVAHLTKCMANEWGKYKIRVNAIAPGWIHSRLADPYLGMPGVNEHHLAKTALGFFGQPDDVALRLYIWLPMPPATLPALLSVWMAVHCSVDRLRIYRCHKPIRAGSKACPYWLSKDNKKSPLLILEGVIFYLSLRLI